MGRRRVGGGGDRSEERGRARRIEGGTRKRERGAGGQAGRSWSGTGSGYEKGEARTPGTGGGWGTRAGARETAPVVAVCKRTLKFLEGSWPPLGCRVGWGGLAAERGWRVGPSARRDDHPRMFGRARAFEEKRRRSNTFAASQQLKHFIKDAFRATACPCRRRAGRAAAASAAPAAAAPSSPRSRRPSRRPSPPPARPRAPRTRPWCRPPSCRSRS